ncbi:MAG: hypothetical protein JKY15_06295 [Deltaproteobacteria bacterium]|nr:hypothetical protein [Deltaproteobacteria bacterium]
MRDHWEPILEARRGNTLDWDSLSEEDRAILQANKIFLEFAWLRAMLEWRVISPKDLLAPALWLLGSDNANSMASLKEYRAVLPHSLVQARVIDGLTHIQEFTEIDKVLPVLLDFTQAVWGDQKKGERKVSK